MLHNTALCSEVLGMAMVACNLLVSLVLWGEREGVRCGVGDADR